MAIVQDKTQLWRVILSHLFVWVFILIVMFPFFVIFVISITPGNFASSGSGSMNISELIPEKISWEHWKNAMCFDPDGVCLKYQGDHGELVVPEFPVLRWLWNSVKVAAISAALILLLSTTSAYAFARMKFKFRAQILDALMLTQMFPSVLALVAIFALFQTIGEHVPSLGSNSHGGLILAYIAGISMHVWTIRGYFDTIPVEIEEAAKVDGATPFQAFRYVLLPMALPILMVVFLLAFISGILEYPVASVLLSDEKLLTFAIGSKRYFYDQKIMWGDFAAAAILSGLPITLVFILAQRWMIAGLTSGAVKG